MEERLLMDKSGQDLEVMSRVAEDELMRVWTELRHRRTPSATALRERIAALAEEITAEVDPPVTPEFGVYVIELDPKVLRTRKFMKRNRNTYLPGRDCLYVGHSLLAPEHRFMQHLRGEHGSSVVQKFGIRLRPEFYDAIDLFETREEAEAKEEGLGELLRSEGYGVWYN